MSDIFVNASIAKTITFIAITLLAHACSDTEKWKEDILLTSGDVITIRRSETRGPDEFFRPGRGITISSSLVANIPPLGDIEYTHQDHNYPLLFDKVNNNLWVAFPILGEEACASYGYPKESIVFKEYLNGKWRIVKFSDAPKNTKVNLAQSSNLWYRSIDASGRRISQAHITIETKQMETYTHWVGHEMPIEQAADFLRTLSNSCEQLQCLAKMNHRDFYTNNENPCTPIKKDLATHRQRNAEAEQQAQLVVAKIESFSTKPEILTKDNYRNLKGDWNTSASITTNCNSIVTRVDTARKSTDNQTRLAGYQIVLGNGEKIQIEEQNLSEMNVACDSSTIYVARKWRDKNDLVIHRFSIEGKLIDATQVSLPDAIKINATTDKERRIIWAISPINHNLIKVHLIDYDYSIAPHFGGTANRSLVYSVIFKND
ncbi:hypothetical protein [Leptothrix ochracea]|uniref:hypothetical protein n=1 Tax=Leptothrix ochracea TaxID=735331 RepID=UPI0034E25471